MINPYCSANFLTFFTTFFARLFGGAWWREGLASDELQLLTLLFIALSASLVGTFLVLRKMTMLANALSHTVLLGIVTVHLLAWAITGKMGGIAVISFPVLFFAALITGLLTTFATQFLKSVLRVQEDASIGLVFTLFFSIGVILVTLFARSSHLSTEIVTGNIDMLRREDLTLSLYMAAFNMLIIILFFKEYKVLAFDEGYAKALGIRVHFYNYLLMFQVAATSIIAFRAVGVLLVLAFMTAPVIVARLYTHSLRHLLFLAPIFAIFVSALGVALSRHLLTVYGLPLSTAGLTVSLMALLLICAMIPYFLKIKAGGRLALSKG